MYFLHPSLAAMRAMRPNASCVHRMQITPRGDARQLRCQRILGGFGVEARLPAWFCMPNFFSTCLSVALLCHKGAE